MPNRKVENIYLRRAFGVIRKRAIIIVYERYARSVHFKERAKGPSGMAFVVLEGGWNGR